MVETVGLGLYFEDLPVGRQFKTIGRTVTEADITSFVNCTGMVEVLFTNTEFLAHESDIKGRPAPGALVYCFAEGLLVQATMQHTGFAFLHMELTIASPVVAGDTIHAECEIIEARRSKSRPERGLVRTRVHVVKQDGTTALVYLASPGGLPMPVDLQLTLASGVIETVRLPVEIWYRGNRYTYARRLAAAPVKVEIDPGMRLPDVRRENNVWTK